jgi:aminoglycoside phosphotransferase family enzyme
MRTPVTPGTGERCPRMIDALLDPAALPDPTTTVHLFQTHISFVLIAGHFVYKVKKPVNFGFLDFSTLEKREFYCHQEVRLNQRLSKDIQWTSDFYVRNQGLFQERISKGKIRDCHGDLHMEHICLTDPVAVIDCIEFNERFRYSDTVSDIAFLLMDLEYHGGGRLASHLWKVYAAESGNLEGG